MNYPRKRASVACQFCRHRKRRCNGERPACALCSESGVACEYPDSASERQDKNSSTGEKGSNEALLRRLDELEALLRRQQPQGQPDTQSQPRSQQSSSPLDHNQPEQPPTPISNSVHNSRSSITHSDIPTLDDPRFAAFLSPLTPAPGPQFMPPSFHTPILTNSGLVVHVEQHSSPDGGEEDEDIPFTIPARHHTTTGSLFSLPQIKRLIGEYPNDFFYQIESSRSLALQTLPAQDLSLVLATLDLRREVTDPLLSSFFAEVHPHFPILDVHSFSLFFDNVLRGSGYDNADTAVCLVVLALGKVASSSPEEAYLDGYADTGNGMEYFSPAYQILTAQWITDFSPGTSLSLGLVLASIYLGYMERPLAAWRLVYMASTKLQMIVSQSEDNPLSQEQSDIVGRLCWTTFLLECDCLAEFHIPRSGIELVIDRMHFPRFSHGIDRDGLLFLALCSVRRLLNRIHNTMYATGSKTIAVGSPQNDPGTATDASAPSPAASTTTSLESVVTELARQLDAWYYSLPDVIKPDLTLPVPQDLQEAWLRLRYWSAKHIISRPCLIYAASASSQQDIPAYVLEYAAICIESCRNYVHTASQSLLKRSQYTSMIIQASLSTAFVLTMASTSRLLSHLVPDIGELLGKVITSVQRWASPDSSAEAVVWILKNIWQKQKLATTFSRSSIHNR